MRVLPALFALSLSVPAIAAGQNVGRPSAGSAPADAKQCRQTTSYLAGEPGIYRGQPLTPRKLTELPPATTYMAVYRHIGGCEAPLTMVDYRNPRRR
jgi:hypothetical protein